MNESSNRNDGKEDHGLPDEKAFEDVMYDSTAGDNCTEMKSNAIVNNEMSTDVLQMNFTSLNDKVTEEIDPDMKENCSSSENLEAEGSIGIGKPSNHEKSKEHPKHGLGSGYKRSTKYFKSILDSPDYSPEEKAKLLYSKCLEDLSEIKSLEKDNQQMRKKWEHSQRECVQLKSDVVKNSSLKQKLESLCRELQKQNKTLQDESKRQLLEEKKARQDLAAKFQASIEDFMKKLEEHSNDRMNQLNENKELQERFQNLVTQYDVREKLYEKQLHAKELEKQVIDLKFKQSEELASKEEKKSAALAKQVAELSKSEHDLRQQLAFYGDKFEEFQGTISKSSEAFSSFKQEIDKMSKHIKKKDKEIKDWEDRASSTDSALVRIIEDNKRQKQQIETVQSQKLKLESLCRTLQEERKSLKEQLVLLQKQSSESIQGGEQPQS